MNNCIIFGAMPIDCTLPQIDKSDLIIAADLGLENLKKLNIKPHIIVGDFDSLNYIPTGNNVIRHPVEKDETDTILAVDIGLKKGYKSFILYGCLGGRLDHTFANIQTGSYIANHGGITKIISKNTVLYIFKNSKLEIKKNSQKIFSVFSLTDVSTGVTIENAKYQVNNTTLKSNFPLGVSNEFVEKNPKISVENGILCVITEE